MRRIYNWFYSWGATLRIKFFEPELYRTLTEDFDPDNFVEVEDPTK